MSYRIVYLNSLNTYWNTFHKLGLMEIYLNWSTLYIF